MRFSTAGRNHRAHSDFDWFGDYLVVMLEESKIGEMVTSEIGQISRARQVVAHLSLLFTWACFAIAAIGVVVEFAHSFRAGLAALGGFGTIAGVLNWYNKVTGRQTWPTPSALREVWRELIGRALD
jgi:hypothetical protein